MSEPPNLAICFLTYKRTFEAIRTIYGVGKWLEYPKDKRAWFINDDGSPPEHLLAIKTMLEGFGETVRFINTERFGGDTYHCGQGWNLTLGQAHQWSDYVLWLEDDWELESRWYIEPYVVLLREHEDVGLVHFRASGIDNGMKNIKIDGVHYHEYVSGPYMYSGNPSLRHARFTKHYGWFSEVLNPDYMEWDMDGNVHKNWPGPRIVRPAGIPEWGVFGHIGKENTFR